MCRAMTACLHRVQGLSERKNVSSDVLMFEAGAPSR